MEENRKMKFRTDRMVFGIFGCLGTVFLIVAVVLLFRFFYVQRNYEKITAEIIEVSESPSYTDIEYSYGEESYCVTLSEYSSSYYPGKKMQIYVDRETPFECVSLLGTVIVLIVFGSMGIIFFAIGVIGLFCAHKIWEVMQKSNETLERARDDEAGVDEYFGNDSLTRPEGNLRDLYGYRELKEKDVKSWSEEAGGR